VNRSIKFTIGGTPAEIFFPKHANFLSVNLIEQYVEKWDKHISSLISDILSKKDAKQEDLEKLVNDWIETVDRSYIDSIDFAEFKFN
jgi:hypothetical protein